MRFSVQETGRYHRLLCQKWRKNRVLRFIFPFVFRVFHCPAWKCWAGHFQSLSHTCTGLVKVFLFLNLSSNPTFISQGAVQVKLELGHRAQVRKKPTVEGFTHDWMVFVRGPEHSNIQHFVEKVVFHLHESFPKPKRGKRPHVAFSAFLHLRFF